MQAQGNATNRKPPAGIELRHSTTCPSRAGGECDAGGRKSACQPSYRAKVYDVHARKWAYKTFRVVDHRTPAAAISAAVAWREAERTKTRAGQRVVQSKITLREAAEQWLAGAKASPPSVLTRANEPYKPSVIRCYENDLTNLVLRDLGALRLSELTRGRLQAWVDEHLIGKGMSGSKVRNVVMPLRVIFRYAMRREWVTLNATDGLDLGALAENPRDRAATASEAASLVAALHEKDRALWATAFYAGLRRGELRALRWENVDLASGVIHVRRSWDDYAGEIAPKSKKGERTVPIMAVLRDHLTEQKARTNGGPRHFVFPGRTNDAPFTPTNIRKRAATAWRAENKRRTKAAEEAGTTPILLEPIGLHECRHTFVSLLHDAGLSLERIGDYVGHSSTYMTDRYRHLLAGHEDETRALMDAYFARADTASRLAQIGGER